MTKTLLNVLILTGTLSSAAAQAITIDANLADWGVQRNGSISDWTPSTGTLSEVEDQSGSGAFKLTPGWGGQAYDAEAMYVNWDTHNLYIAIATGHNPYTINNPARNSYAAGDIAIDFGNNDSWDYGIELMGGSNTQRGHVYSNVVWAYGLWDVNGNHVSSAHADPAHPTSILSGTEESSNAATIGSVANTAANSGENGYGVKASDLHYFYEVAVPLAVFGNDWGVGTQFEIHWTQNCANDSISTLGTISPRNQTVPEPATLALLPLGLIGIAALRRRNRT